MILSVNYPPGNGLLWFGKPFVVDPNNENKFRFPVLCVSTLFSNRPDCPNFCETSVIAAVWRWTVAVLNRPNRQNTVQPDRPNWAHHGKVAL